MSKSAMAYFMTKSSRFHNTVFVLTLDGAGTNIKLDKYQVGDKHQVGQTSSRTNIKLDIYQVGHTSSWTNIKLING